MRKALVIVDMQHEFYTHKEKVFDTKIIPNLKKRLEYFRENNLPVIHLITEYNQDRSDWPNVRKSDESIWCLKGSKSAEIIKGFEPLEDEPLLIKKRFSGFYNTKLRDTLEDMEVTQICLGGYSSDACVRMTAVDAYNIGFDVVLFEDSMDADYKKTNEAINYLKWLIKAKVE